MDPIRKWMRSPRVTLTSVLFAPILACSGVPPVPVDSRPEDAGGAAPDAADELDPPGDVGPPTCTAQSECKAPKDGTPPAGWQCVKTVTIAVVDVSGRPLAGLPVACCGKNLCIVAKSDATGHATVGVCHYMDQPAFKFRGGRDYVSFVAPIPNQDVVTIAPTTLVRFPIEGGAFPPPGQAADVYSGGATLSIDATTTVKVSSIDNPKPEDQQFRATEVPVDKLPPGLDVGLGLELVYGLGPLDTRFDPPAPLSLPNPRGWRAGTEVEFFLQGVDTSSKYAPYAGWKSFASGRVSEDGAVVSMDSGGGIPELAMVGVRKKQ